MQQGKLPIDFNPRSREGSDSGRRLRNTASGGFQSTLPRRERQEPEEIQAEVMQFQSTLPRRERPPTGRGCGCSNQISIHAPAKGATEVSYVIPVNPPISIHAPAKGATIQYFFRLGIKEISIHAPAKGATVLSIQTITDLTQFQSTLPRRERRLVYCNI